MMLTCSALRCSVFDGSAISGTSDDPGADDPLASQCIPDSVLYITVDDEALVDVFCDFEHPMQLSFDAPGHIRARRGREIDLREIFWAHDLEKSRVLASLGVRREETVDVRREHGPLRADRAGEFEHHQVARADGESAAQVANDIAESHGCETHG